MLVGKKETISITTFKKWPFSNDFRIETEDGKSLSALRKFCFKVEYTCFYKELGSGRKVAYIFKVFWAQSYLVVA